MGERAAMNYQACYEWGRKQLEAAGVQEARLDARLLLETACAVSFSDLLAHGERPVEPAAEERYREWISLRASHIPLQHITGYQEFMGLEFLVSDKVLIPRQDTEILVEEVLRQMTDGSRILDMCTGSGCILLSLLHYSNGCVGVGADISADALGVAEENAKRLGIQADFIQSDLFEKVTGKFDYIVSNPPYVTRAEMETLEPSVRDFEPHMALDGGEDGLRYYREIVRNAPLILKRGGTILFEVGIRQSDDVRKILADAGYSTACIKDDQKIERVVLGKKD